MARAPMATVGRSWLSPRVRVRKSAIHGVGWLATEAIEEGETIVRWGGRYAHRAGDGLLAGAGETARSRRDTRATSRR